jgi:membrane fusion protein (multidrug efflux system)
MQPDLSFMKIFAKPGVLPLFLPAILVLAGCNRRTQAPPAPVPEVATIVVAQQPLLLTTELPGRTSPYRIAEIRPQVSGLIQSRLFVEGSDVTQGQDLYQIDPAPFKAALDNAKAALGRAEANVPPAQLRADRYKSALLEKAVSQQEYDDAAAALKQAEADVLYYKAMVETARINLAYSRVVSPISGRIGKSSVTDGAIVTSYQPTPLATIQQLDPIYVDVPQSTSQLLRLRQSLADGSLNHESGSSNRVKLILENGSAYPAEGTLEFQDISVDPTTGSVILRMVFPNPNGVLLPGMFVRAMVKEGVNDHAILIPQQSVSRDPKGNPSVLVVSADGKVAQRPLTLDRAMGGQWLVAGGLTPGERVVVEGGLKVRPGMQVKEVPSVAGGSPAAGAAVAAQGAVNKK